MKEYNPNEIEKKWQKVWEDEGVNRARDNSDKPKYYCLVEFPYPSGDGLHTGHARSYTAMDIIARKRRAEGYNVLYPIGWDAFGLPTENYAIKTKTSPKEVTKQNTDIFRRQLKSLGFSFDWSREINTTEPKYYKWTQWIFLEMFKRGLAYKKKTSINWCIDCKIGLANEEVVNGLCERCGGQTEKREKEQWMLAITKYADRLYDDLDTVDYLEKIKIQQRNWIGRSQGAEISFQLLGFSQTNADLTQTDAEGEIRSYIMGVNNIDSDLKAIGVNIFERTKEGNYKVTIPKNKIQDYEKLISKALKPGFWNEYIGDKTVFIFKDTSGNICRFIWSKSNEPKLLNLCNTYANAQFKSIRKMLEGNNWYGNFLRKSALSPRESATLTTVNIFTTRPDTLFGATYMVLAPEHEVIENIKSRIENWDEVLRYIVISKKKTEIERTAEGKEKTGVELKGVKAINPANKEEIPIYIADYVLEDYGTGAIMAVPAHDVRDHAFAIRYNIPIKEVISARTNADITLTNAEGKNENLPYLGVGILINSGKFDGMDSEEAKKKITEFVGGGMKTTYKLRDWVFSRQRYWGEPIPLVYCVHCAEQVYKLKKLNKLEELKKQSQGEVLNPGWVAMPEDELPVLLPEVSAYTPTDTGESPLAKIDTWVNVKCQKCGGDAKRETDTMPNWAGSSWYFLRYVDPSNDEKLADRKKLDYFMPVDWYNGGMEHTTLHLLYSRFWHKFLFDIGVVKDSEPYKKRTSHGMILAEGGEKMSKSKDNIVNPDSIVETYGADTLRLYEMFMGPFDQAVAWSTKSIIGPRRFLERVWRLKLKISAKGGSAFGGKNEKLKIEDNKIRIKLHRTIKKVTEDIELMHFNTAMSELMIFANELDKLEKISQEYYECFLKLLSPFAPHITEEIWQSLGHEKSIHIEPWPAHEERHLKSDTIKIAVQVNGRVRAVIELPSTIDEEIVKKSSLDDERVKKWIGEGKIGKIIYVKEKLVSIVLAG